MRLLLLLLLTPLAGCAALDRAAETAKQAAETADTLIIATPVGQLLPPDWRAGLLLGTTVLSAALAAYEAKRAGQAQKTLGGVVKAVETVGAQPESGDTIRQLKDQIAVNQAAAGNYDTAERLINHIKQG